MNIPKTYLNIIIAISIVCLLFTPTISLAEIHHLTILHTNDHKGHFMKFDHYPMPDVGGMAARSTLVNIVRAEVEEVGGHVLLLSGGDINIGTPESDLLNAEPDFKLMNMLGYDAMVLGNMEFDIPRDVLMKQREWAGCPFLSANIVKKETGESLVEPYIIKEFDGLKIAIFGLTRAHTPAISTYAKDLDGRSPIEITQTLVPKLQAEADIVIALSHLGMSGPRETDSVELAKKVPGIDVIVGGLRGMVLDGPEIVGETLIVQASDYGLHVGRLDLTIDSDRATITEYSYKLIPVNLKKRVKFQGKSYYRFVDNGYVEDSAVLEFIQPYLEQTDRLLSQPIGEALVRLNGDIELVRYQETNLANLITDSMRVKTGVEIAFRNGGGIRASIESGPIAYRDILRVLPFGNTLVLLDMTGTQIMDVLNHAATTSPGDGGFLHGSGLTWTNRKGLPEDMRVGGAPIEMERMYKVAADNYLIGGGDGYTMFKDLPYYDTGFTLASTLREYIMKQGTVAPKVEGRLTIIE